MYILMQKIIGHKIKKTKEMIQEVTRKLSKNSYPQYHKYGLQDLYKCKVSLYELLLHLTNL